MNTSQQWLLFSGLLLILCVALFFQLMDESEPQRVPLLYKTGQTVRDQARIRQPQTLSLSFSSENDVSRPTTFTQPRNIFAPLFQKKASIPKSSLSKASVAPPLRPLPPSQPSIPFTGPSPEELAAEQARAQLSQFLFLGYLTRGSDRQVFLSKGKAIYIVQQGEIIEGDIEVRATDPTAVTLAKPIPGTGKTVETTLPLTKDKTNAAL